MTEHRSIQYVTDEAGNKKAVLIPLDEWLAIEQTLAQLKELLALKESLATGFREVAQIKKGLAPKVSLSDFLNES